MGGRYGVGLGMIKSYLNVDVCEKQLLEISLAPKDMKTDELISDLKTPSKTSDNKKVTAVTSETVGDDSSGVELDAKIPTKKDISKKHIGIKEAPEGKETVTQTELDANKVENVDKRKRQDDTPSIPLDKKDPQGITVLKSEEVEEAKHLDGARIEPTKENKTIQEISPQTFEDAEKFVESKKSALKEKEVTAHKDKKDNVQSKAIDNVDIETHETSVSAISIAPHKQEDNKVVKETRQA